MSLNGLEDSRILEAYQSCLAEAGGWFLLKYASRDEIELYKRGAGGVSEAKTAINEFDEKAPLYGYLIFRRRKILIKYTPEGLSRLLQARVTVHFQSVESKFVPHDAVLHVTTAEEITEASLTSIAGLHSAAVADSIRSSAGSQQRRSKLDEIIEDPKERPSYDARPDSQNPPQSTARTLPVPAIAEPAPPQNVQRALSAASAASAADVVSRPVTADSIDREAQPVASRKAAAILGIPQTVVSSVVAEQPYQPAESPHKAGEVASLYAASIHSLSKSDYPSISDALDDPGATSATARPSLSDLYHPDLFNPSFYPGKPKVKLGPRPSTDTTKLAPTARPVASLPAGLRVAPRRRDADTSSRPVSRASSMMSSISAASTTVPFIVPPPIPEHPPTHEYRPVSSSNSIMSTRTMPVTLASKSEKLTAEKRRLRKAVEMRKKQMQAAKRVGLVADEAEIDKLATLQTSSSSRNAGSDVGSDMAVSAIAEDASEGTVEQPAQQQHLRVETARQQTSASDKSTPTLLEHPPDTLPSPASPATSTPENNFLRNPSRMSGVHIKADSGIDIDVAKQQPDAKDNNVDGIPTEAAIPLENGVANAGPKSLQGLASTQADNLADGPADHDEKENTTRSTEERVRTPEGLPEITPVSPVLAFSSPTKLRLELGNDMSSPAAAESNEAHLESGNEVSSPRGIRGSHLEEKRRTNVSGAGSEKTALSVPISGSRVGRTISLEPTSDMSDDDLVKELRGAEIQEAKPAQVVSSSQTAITSVLSTSPKAASPERKRSGMMHPLRDMTNTSDQSPRPASRKSQSPAEQGITVAKNISSGISQRIKALARQSSAQSEAALNHSTSPDVAGPSLAIRKSSLRDTTPPSQTLPSSAGRSPSTRERGHSFYRNSPLAEAIDEDESSAASHYFNDGLQTVYNVQHRGDSSQSISVTARIVRDNKNSAQSLQLHESPLIIEHNRVAHSPSIDVREPSPVRALPSADHRPLTPPRAADKPGPRSPTTSVPRGSSDTWRSSIFRHAHRRSDKSSRAVSLKSPSRTSIETYESRSDDGKERGSRGSRLLKRMSFGRKTIAQLVSTPTVAEEDHRSAQSNQQRSGLDNGYLVPYGAPRTVEIGDMNVQLPDTLLWKRRWVEIDGHGNFVIKMSKSNEMANTRAMQRAFHLSEFRRPLLPDSERMEMPNSVVLEFLDGRTLQCACETSVGQREVLRLLQEAHSNWSIPRTR